MGIVHHSNYYAWFEVGRTEFFQYTGLSYGELENQGILFPLIQSSCIYKEGAKYQDELIIRTWIQEVRGAKIVFCYEVIRDKDQKIISEGRTVHACVNRDIKPINLKKVNNVLWENLQQLSKDGN